MINFYENKKVINQTDLVTSYHLTWSFNNRIYTEQYSKLLPAASNYTVLTLIRESWKKLPKLGTITERVSRKKIQSAALNRFVYVSVLWIFSEMTLGDGPKKARIRVKRLILLTCVHVGPSKILN